MCMYVRLRVSSGLPMNWRGCHRPGRGRWNGADEGPHPPSGKTLREVILARRMASGLSELLMQSHLGDVSPAKECEQHGKHNARIKCHTASEPQPP